MFEPKKIGNLELKNRLVRSATAERMVDRDGAVTDDLIKLYETLSRGGIGTIITGHCFVRADGRSGWLMTGIHQDSLISGLQRLTGIVHRYDVKIFAQLNHTGRYAPGSIIGTNPLAPSVSESDLKGVYPPKEMTGKEIKELVQAFAQAAVRARESGFDGVQIHAAHGYLVNQFLSPYFNKRKDEWGGSLENRARLLYEILTAIKKTVGAEWPVWVKLNCEDFVEGGFSLSESLTVAEKLGTLPASGGTSGIDAIEISGGVQFQTVIQTGIDCPDKEAYFLPQAREFRKKITKPLLLVGGIRSRSVIEMILGGEGIDLVSLSRPLIKEPDFPHKLNKKTDDRATCVSCNACLGKRNDPVQCRLEEKIVVKKSGQ
ncbi:MAG: NADH:flavin oxidoreductase [Planctomycetota bacterium]